MGEQAPIKTRQTTRRDFVKRGFGAVVAGMALGLLGRGGDAPRASAAESAKQTPAPLAELLDESAVSEGKKIIKPADQPAVLDQTSEDGRKFGILGDLTGYFPDGDGRLGLRVEGGKVGSMGIMVGHPNADKIGGDVIGIEVSGGKITINHWRGGVGPKSLQPPKQPIAEIAEGSYTDAALDLSEGGSKVAGVLPNGDVSQEQKQLGKPLTGPGEPLQVSYWKTPDSDANLLTVVAAKA